MKRLLILALVVLILASTVLAASAITSTSDDVLEEKAENLVTNPSFESGYGQEIPGWEITGNLESAYTENGGYTGQRQLSFWNETNSYEVSASQTVAEIPDGTYSLSMENLFALWKIHSHGVRESTPLQGKQKSIPAPYWDRSNFLQSCSPGSNGSQTGWVLDILHGNRFGLNLRKRIISGTMAAS